MSLVKSLFISLYMILLVTVDVNAGAAYLRTYDAAWLGALLTALPMTLFLIYILVAKRVARTGRNLLSIFVVTVLGFVFTLFHVLALGGEPAALIMAAAGLVAFLIYNFWYSRFGNRGSAALAVGNELPEFVLETAEGAEVSSHALTERPTVWLFYRGNWCPLCMAQIREIAAGYREIDARGAQVVLVSPQPHGKTRSLARKFDAPMKFMADPGAKAAKKLGIAAPFGLPFGMQLAGYRSTSVLPTVVITDRNGKILFVDETDNYRVRPEPATFLNVLDAQRA